MRSRCPHVCQKCVADLDVPLVPEAARSLADLVQLYWNDYGVQHWVDAALFLNDEARFSTIPGALKEELRVRHDRAAQYHLVARTKRHVSPPRLNTVRL